MRLDGVAPQPALVRMDGDAACGGAGEAAPAGDVLVRGGRIENAFVYVAAGLEARVFDEPREPVVIEQRSCAYRPRIVGAETGQEIVFVNDDPTLHNVRTMPQLSSAVNFGMSARGERRSIRIAKSEVMVQVRCDVHPWMRAYLGVLDHPYFALTGRDGAFRLANLPPGDYTIAVWHERLGRASRKTTVPSKGEARVDFTLAP